MPTQMPDSLGANVDKLYEIFEQPTFDTERKKIESKLNEAKYHYGDPHILADCMLALLLIGKSWGASPQVILDELEKLAEKATEHHWKKMPDGTFQAF